MPNADYWRKRMQTIEEAQHNKTKDYYQYAQEQFRKTEASINREIELGYAKLAENNGISLSAAKELLRKDELEEFHWTVEEYIKKGESLDYSDQWREALKNASAKVHINRLEALKLQVQQECEVLYGNLNDNVDAMLRDIYTEGYYRTAFELQKGTGVGYTFDRLDTRRVRTAINTAWAQDGKNYSDRLWQNKEKLVNNLNEKITQNIIRGENPRKAIDELSKEMNTSKSNVGRLYMTESAAIAAKSQKECYKELGVDEFEFVASLDSDTCGICQSMDGRHFPMTEYEVGLTAQPLHPNCRCVTIPYFPDDEEEGTRAARNEEGKTMQIPANMTYRQWKEKYVDKKDVEKTSGSGIIKADKVISGHDSTPKQYKQNGIIDHLGEDGKVETRTYYGIDGYKLKDITNHNHNNPKTHPYGKKGEHAHDYNWDYKGVLKNRTTRDINDDERRENSDML